MNHHEQNHYNQRNYSGGVGGTGVEVQPQSMMHPHQPYQQGGGGHHLEGGRSHPSSNPPPHSHYHDQQQQLGYQQSGAISNSTNPDG